MRSAQATKKGESMGGGGGGREGEELGAGWEYIYMDARNICMEYIQIVAEKHRSFTRDSRGIHTSSHRQTPTYITINHKHTTTHLVEASELLERPCRNL